MNILIISDYDRIALDLHSNILDHYGSSTLLTTKCVAESKSVINISRIKNKKYLWFINVLRSFCYRFILLRVKDYLYFQDIGENNHYYNIRRIINRVKIKPDIVIILFDYRIITAKTIYEIYKWSKAKIVWIMVDMKPMTGGCSYSKSCSKYQLDCKNCPAINNRIFNNFAYQTLKQKIKYLEDVDLHLFAGSTFQANQAHLSTVFKNKPISTVFFPCDGNIFRYKEKIEARRLLSLPLNKTIIMWGAEKIDAPRKGYKYLVDALTMLQDSVGIENIVLLSVGKGEMSEIKNLRIQTVDLGWVTFNDLALAYQASDVFVCPSIEDSGPIMVNQSIMCGTPVVAFKMGVCLDLVKNGKTGYLSDVGDAEGLYNGIKKILGSSNNEKDEMRNECLQVAKKLNFTNFVQNVEKLIQEK